MASPTFQKRRISRSGRFALIFLAIVAVTAGFFVLASFLFAFDPSGQKVKGWLSASRYGLFAWRLTLYTLLGYTWFGIVRPQVLKISPGSSLRRLEWMAALFISVLEFAAWRSVLA